MSKSKLTLVETGDKNTFHAHNGNQIDGVRESLQRIDQTAKIVRLNSVRVITRLDQTARDSSQLKADWSGCQLV
jgi:hypothetical protein